MRITTIRYERLHNLGNFSHEKFTAEAVLPEGDDPIAAGAELRTYVDEQIESAEAARRLEYDADPFREGE